MFKNAACRDGEVPQTHLLIGWTWLIPRLSSGHGRGSLFGYALPSEWRDIVSGDGTDGQPAIGRGAPQQFASAPDWTQPRRRNFRKSGL